MKNQTVIPGVILAKKKSFEVRSRNFHEIGSRNAEGGKNRKRKIGMRKPEYGSGKLHEFGMVKVEGGKEKSVLNIRFCFLFIDISKSGLVFMCFSELYFF